MDLPEEIDVWLCYSGRSPYVQSQQRCRRPTVSTRPRFGLAAAAKIARKMTHRHDNVTGAAGICSAPRCAAQAWELVNAVLASLIILLFCPAPMKDLLVYDTCITRCEL